MLTYLTMADVIRPSGKLTGFRELPAGSNYCHAFQDDAPDKLSIFLFKIFIECVYPRRQTFVNAGEKWDSLFFIRHAIIRGNLKGS